MNKYKITMVSGKEYEYLGSDLFYSRYSEDLEHLHRENSTKVYKLSPGVQVQIKYIESIEVLPDFETGGIVLPKDGQRITVGE